MRRGGCGATGAPFPARAISTATSHPPNGSASHATFHPLVPVRGGPHNRGDHRGTLNLSISLPWTSHGGSRGSRTRNIRVRERLSASSSMAFVTNTEIFCDSWTLCVSCRARKSRSWCLFSFCLPPCWHGCYTGVGCDKNYHWICLFACLRRATSPEVTPLANFVFEQHLSVPQFRNRGQPRFPPSFALYYVWSCFSLSACGLSFSTCAL